MLKPRLEAILSLVENADIVADVGCDHGFLSIAMIESGKATKVYASDVAIGPLSTAKKNVEAKGLSNSIECILSDGLKNIPEDVDTVVIAGMGAYTAIDILNDAKERLSSFKNIIIQVNSDMEDFRRWISDNHYLINKEMLVEDFKIYTIIRFNTNYGECLDENELVIGPYLLRNRDDLYYKYYDLMFNKFMNIANVATRTSQIENALQYANIYKKAIEE